MTTATIGSSNGTTAPKTRVLTNNRSNETVQTTLTNQQILVEFFKTAKEDHWLYYWMAKHVEDLKKATPATKEMMEFLGDSFLYAIGMGLKKPMIRLHWEGRRYKIYLSKKGTLCFKSGMLVPGTHNPQGDEEYMGCLYGGKILPPNRQYEKKIRPEEERMLTLLGADPVGFLAQASKDMDRCCYCNQPLEDERSKEVGYGKICAGRWGLPWGTSYDEKVPSFAQLWQRSTTGQRNDVRGICMSIRKTPRDAFLWGLLGDALTDAGFTKRPEMPSSQVIIPSAA